MRIPASSTRYPNHFNPHANLRRKVLRFGREATASRRCILVQSLPSRKERRNLGVWAWEFSPTPAPSHLRSVIIPLFSSIIWLPKGKEPDRIPFRTSHSVKYHCLAESLCVRVYSSHSTLSIFRWWLLITTLGWQDGSVEKGACYQA